MPKIIDHDQRRREIVEVAKKLIVEGGFEAATIRSIVTAAGYANGALKHYFPNKHSIIVATFESVLAEMEQHILAGEPPIGPVEGLRAYVEGLLPLDRYRIASARVLLALWEHSVSNPELAQRYVEHLQTWRADLVRRVIAARGRDEPEDAPAVTVLADEIIAVSIGANVTNLMYPDGALVPRYQAYVDDLMERLLR